MKLEVLLDNRLFRPGLGALATVLCGLLLWKTPIGDPWVNASYDYSFRFGARAVTNKVAVILMDNEAFDQYRQLRDQPWDRALHTELLNRLADDGCPLVVFDAFFRVPRDPVKDAALAESMRRLNRIVLMAEQAQVTHPAVEGARPTLPTEPFLSAAGHWGVAWLDPDLDSIVRRHWPFPAPGPYPSLPETVARLAGAPVSQVSEERWLRYYGRDGAWTRLSYRFADSQPAGYFRDKIVFVGTQPKTSVADGERDEFRTPYTRWTGETVGGVEIMAASFLNLVNGDWLRRPAWWTEALVLVVVGAALGFALCRLRTPAACVLAAGFALAAFLGAVSWSHYGNHWFPWLVITAGQAPCALAWALATRRRAPTLALEPVRVPVLPPPPPSVEVHPVTGPIHELPEVADYELLQPPFGQGAYGKVWLARNAVGQWQALKVVYLANFGQDADPYEREFSGIRRYKPISDKHPGLLRVDFVSMKKQAGYFYYVMELGDPLEPGWEREPSTYRPRDLVSERRRSRGQKLPVRDCLRIGIAIADALDFLHRQGLTHRDIKPQNIIFVNGHPKLADVGLIAEIRPPDQERTSVGTPGYMPPLPEMPGTPQADIYALGMVLYVLSTGNSPAYFPEISTTLVKPGRLADFFPLNTVILKACQPDARERYQTAAEMHQALLAAQESLEAEPPDKSPGP